MFNYKYLFLLAFCIVTLSVHGQQNQKINRSAFTTKRPVREHLPNTVIVKLKPQLSKQAPGSIKTEFSSINKKISVAEMDRMFPNVEPLPRMKTNKMGIPFVDLSRTYVVRYSSELPIEQVIDELLNSGKVEYAHPFYIDQILYVPNDPLVDSITGNAQFYLNAMKYYQALNVEKGDPNVVIGIIDTGTKQDHEDLIDNIAVNPNDPINGLDDDGDTYVDNYRGWDLGDNDNNTFNPNNDHGCNVAGTAGATPDNGKGLAGTGYNCKILPIKAAKDNSGGAIVYGLEGIVYAAKHGCKVINLSFGGSGGYNQTYQDVINFAAINYDVVVVAAAGNDALDAYYYPASYDNVLSVASVEAKYLPSLDTTVEVKAYFATYSYAVDVCAQGYQIVSTNHSAGGYSYSELGSSFSSPLVAGAAGLLRSHYPSYNALQIAELIRVTADPLIDTIAENIEFKNGKLGKGRINMYRALTDTKTPAIRMYNDSIYSKLSPHVFGGDTIFMACKFINYLHPPVNAHVEISAVSSNVTVIDGSFDIGSPSMMATRNNSAQPFKLYLPPNDVVDDVIIIRFDYTDPATGYSDFQYLTFAINPSYVDININKVSLTVTSDSRLGYLDSYYAVGHGFIYNNNQLLYEGGLMISNGSEKVADAVRSNIGASDNDFATITRQKYAQLSE